MTGNSYSENLEDSKVKISLKGTKTVRFDGAFNPANPAKTEYSLEMFSLYITDLLTPRSTEPTSSFKVRIYDDKGYLQYKKDSLAYSQVSQAQNF